MQPTQPGTKHVFRFITKYLSGSAEPSNLRIGQKMFHADGVNGCCVFASNACFQPEMIFLCNVELWEIAGYVALVVAVYAFLHEMAGSPA
jgi:hypothetical protein